jgi:hypothetical protein
MLHRTKSDERGSVTLLCAMMVFLLAVFSLITLNTNQSIRHRIISQNAVDSAADSAALWQARGCNLLQQLNNLHYEVNRIAAIGEKAAAVSCGVAVVLRALESVVVPPWVAAAAKIARPLVCYPLCDPLPIIDAVQQKFYEVLMPLQRSIATVTPFLAFAYANANAKGSGADPLIESAAHFGGQLLAEIGIVEVTKFDDLAGAIPGGLMRIPIYAAPLDPTSLSLHVREIRGDGAPWQFARTTGDIGNVLGLAGCEDKGFEKARDIAKNSLRWNGKYGWNDNVFVGNPGFMTWIAGKSRRDELSGLGAKGFRWFNGGKKDADEVSQVLFQDTTPEPGSNILEIPAFLTIASSQVEGDPVIPKGNVDAAGKIIKVHIPAGARRWVEGDKVFIYH